MEVKGREGELSLGWFEYVYWTRRSGGDGDGDGDGDGLADILHGSVRCTKERKNELLIISFNNTIWISIWMVEVHEVIPPFPPSFTKQ